MLINKHITYIVKHNNNQINNDDLDTSAKLSLQLNENHQKNLFLIHRVLKEQIRQHRHGNAHSKTRSEIRGGGKKPWKQKGTGRARAGSSRSPLWKGGGVIFGPRSCNIYKSKINKKEKKLAIKNILYNKAHATSIIANNFHDLVKPNTKVLLDQLKSMGVIINTNTRTLLVVDKKYTNLYLSIRNIYYIDIIQADQLNALELLKAHQIIITTDGFKLIKQIYHDYN